MLQALRGAISGLTFGGAAFLAALALFPRWRKERLAEPATGLFFAGVITYLGWLAEFGIQRYIATLDILCGAGVLFLALQVRWPLVRLGVLVAVTIVSWIVLAVPDWGHLPWRPYWQAINPNPLDFGGPTIVFLTGPNLYIAASLPETRAMFKLQLIWTCAPVPTTLAPGN